MLDHRVYRAAFLPALVALFVVAFSLTDPGDPRTTRLAPDAFDGTRTFGATDPPPRNSLRELGRSFPDRRPGSPGDAALADRVAEVLDETGFGGSDPARREAYEADTAAGRRTLEDVVAVRQGRSSSALVVVAHRDARQGRGKALAELSGTAALLELGRLLADRDLPKTIVLASVSGGSGGFAGARRVAERLEREVEAVVVLGDLASRRLRRPFVVPWSNGRAPAPWSLQRTAEAALRKEVLTDPGRDRAIVQWIRRALPLTLGEQGAVGAAGLSAVLVSASGERGPRPGAAVRERRLDAFGRGVLRTLTAALEVDTSGSGADEVVAFPRSPGVVTVKRLVPEWAVRLMVGALLLPALLAAFDAFFRARRRGLPAGRRLVWAASFALGPLAAWGWARALDLVGGITALSAPAAGAVALGTGGVVAMVSAVLVGLAVAFFVRPLVVRALGPMDPVAAGGAAAATGLGLTLLVLAVWVANPYAAGVLLPAAHAWLLASAPGARTGRRAAVAAVLAGLLLPAAVVAYYFRAWDLGPIEGLWTTFGLIAGGVLGVADALALTGLFAALTATLVIIGRQVRTADGAPPERLRTRGPRSYAGPGSLGGTESALRR